MLRTPKALEADIEGKAVSQSKSLQAGETGAGGESAEGVKELWPTREKS